MAEFNTTLGPNNVQDYTGASKGYTDNALGGLFTDIAQGFDMGIKATDQFLQRRVEDSARSMVEPLRDAAIADVAGVAAGAPAGADIGAGTYIDPETGEASPGTPALPADAQAQFSRLGNIKQGVRAGSLSDSYYRSQLDVVSKKLRRMYPGYEDSIDNSLEKLTGSVPANKLLSDLQSQASAALSASSGAANKIQTAWLKGVNDGTIDPSLHPLASVTSLQDVATIVSPRAMAKANLEIDNANMANRKGHNEEYSDDTKKRSLNGASNITTEVMSSLSSPLGKSFDDWMTRLGQIKNQPNAPLDGKAAAEFDARTDQLVTGLRTKLNSYYNTPIDDSGTTRASLLGSEETTKQISSQVSRITDLMGDLKDQNSNKLVHNASLIKAWSEGKQADYLSDPNGLTLKAITDLYGGTVAGAYLSSPEGAMLMGSIGTLGHNNASLNIANGKYRSLGEAVQKTTDSSLTPSQKQAVGDQLIKTLGTAVASKDVPPELKTRTIQAMYGPQNEGFIKNNVPMYTKMANPVNLQNIKKFSEETGQPELWNMAKSWVIKTGTSLALNQAVQMQNALVYNKFGTIQYDSKTHSFNYIKTDTGIEDPRLNDIQRFTENTIQQFIKEPAARAAVSTMNQMVSGMATAFRLDNPKASDYDINAYVTNLTKSLGVDLGAAKQPNGVQTFFGALYDAAEKTFPRGALTGPNGYFRGDGKGGVQLTWTRNEEGQIIPRDVPGQSEEETANQRETIQLLNPASSSAANVQTSGPGARGMMRLGASDLAGSPDAEALMGDGSLQPGDPSVTNSGPPGAPPEISNPAFGADPVAARQGILQDMKEMNSLFNSTEDPELKAEYLKDLKSLQEAYRTLRQPPVPRDPELVRGPTPAKRKK